MIKKYLFKWLAPSFLLEMSKQLHEQDNRITAEPIFEVRCKRYLVTEEGYSESHWELHSDDSEGYPIYSSKEGFDSSESAKELFEANAEWCEEWLLYRDLIELDDDVQPSDVYPEGHTLKLFEENFFFETDHDWPTDIKVIHLQEVEETIRTCFTEADAKAFIARKQHDYPKLYTYVQTMNYCPQMIELRNWIMGLTK